MKIKMFLKDVAMSIFVVAGFSLATAVILAISLAEAIDSLFATATFNQVHRHLLRQLRKVSQPVNLLCNPFDVECDRAGHGKSCTPENCPVTRTDRHQELVERCRQAGIKGWRIRLAGVPNY